MGFPDGLLFPLFRCTQSALGFRCKSSVFLPPYKCGRSSLRFTKESKRVYGAEFRLRDPKGVIVIARQEVAGAYGNEIESFFGGLCETYHPNNPFLTHAIPKTHHSERRGWTQATRHQRNAARRSARSRRRGRIELGVITSHNIKQLKRLNQVVFPVTYNDKFYKDVLEVGELAKLAYYNDIVIGAVCCRIENQRRLYIMTLGCLAPYRRLGIGTVMLEHVLSICEKDGNIDNVFLHVQVNNEGAIRFYERFGFKIVEEKKNYYKRIEPADAYVLQKSFKESSDIEATKASSPAEESNDLSTCAA